MKRIYIHKHIVIDVCKKPTFNVSNDLFETLHNLYALVNKKTFIIRNDGIDLYCVILRTKKYYSDHYTYDIKCDISYYPEITKNDIIPLWIMYQYPPGYCLCGRGCSNDLSVYIANISKTNDITGTNIVNLALTLLRFLKVKKCSLHDGARVSCNKDIQIDLSVYKLFTNSASFYEKFGFKLVPDVETEGMTTDEIYELRNKYVAKFNTIKLYTFIKELCKSINYIMSIISVSVIKHKFKYNDIDMSHITKDDILPWLLDNMNHYVDILTHIGNNKYNGYITVYLVEYLKHLGINHCELYNNITTVQLNSYISNKFINLYNVHKIHNVIPKTLMLLSDILNIGNLYTIEL
jgi:hypothetical protein